MIRANGLLIVGLGMSWLVNAAGAAERVGDAAPDSGHVVFPGADWAKASPVLQRVDPAQLKVAVEFLDRSLGDYGGAGSLFIVRHGYEIWSGFFSRLAVSQ